MPIVGDVYDPVLFVSEHPFTLSFAFLVALASTLSSRPEVTEAARILAKKRARKKISA